MAEDANKHNKAEQRKNETWNNKKTPNHDRLCFGMLLLTVRNIWLFNSQMFHFAANFASLFYGAGKVSVE